MSAEKRLQELNIRLQASPKVLGTYAALVRSGNLLFVAGQGPMKGGKPTIQGKVGAKVSVEQAYEAARLTCLNALTIIREAIGSLDRVKRVVQARVYVACTDDFQEQPKVANGATDLLKELFGEAGLPARAAVGVNTLPMDIPVELELVVEVHA